MRSRPRSRSRWAVAFAAGCSLGVGPWRCSAPGVFDGGPGPGSGPGSGHGNGSSTGVASIPPLPPAPTPEPAPPIPPPPPTPPPAPPAPPARPAAPPTAPPIATTPRREEPTPRETLGPKKPPPGPPRAIVPDEIIMSAVRALHPTFVACWRRAQRNDPSLTSARVRLTLEVDEAGAITAARTDAEDEKLGRCLAAVARKLTFPALGRPAAFDIPLHF